jgi:signal transduction histidine kinase
VIVSTATTDGGEAALRVRDTGSGMTADEVEAAMEPFRPVAATRRSEGSGLGLPLSKALAEANRATLSIASGRHEGTLVEVKFPTARMSAE